MLTAPADTTAEPRIITRVLGDLRSLRLGGPLERRREYRVLGLGRSVRMLPGPSTDYRVAIPSASDDGSKLAESTQIGQSALVPSAADEWIGGDVADGFGVVADAFRLNFRTRREIGAAIAVYRDGEKVVDLWGGWRDPQRSRKWDADTLVPVFSTTKGLTAAAMAVAHSRALFELDEPVATYWPEFAQYGKEAVTVRQLFAHEAGLAVIDQRLDLATIADSDALGTVLAAQAPKWPPGTAHGYHAQTLGWYESQLLQRVDPAHRSIGAFFADEVAAPLDGQFFIGVTDDALLERLRRSPAADGSVRRSMHIRCPGASCSPCSTRGA